MRSLTRQTGVIFDNLEVLVVDNNSNDDTQEVVGAFSPLVPIKYVLEPTQGLAIARNRGIKESQGKTLLFADDDVLLDSGWLAGYLQAFDVFADAGFFGGRICPGWTDCPRPAWLKDERLPLLSGVLGCHDLGETSRIYSAEEDPPFGASFAVRRAVFAKLAGFRTDLGVRGGSRGRGEDTELLNRARRSGVSGVYVGEALCWHRV
ncbi:MAG: glycosyltransferase, partial [Nitrososphaera sp.]|nr:glycosyltransferase [Nitrososphaera sp.]